MRCIDSSLVVLFATSSLGFWVYFRLLYTDPTILLSVSARGLCCADDALFPLSLFPSAVPLALVLLFLLLFLFRPAAAVSVRSRVERHLHTG